jgi:hypothetical protein
MINNSININKTKNQLSAQVIREEESHPMKTGNSLNQPQIPKRLDEQYFSYIVAFIIIV